MTETLLIGDVARLLGISTKALRHYEEIGLIDPHRTESDYRVYTPEDVLRVERIRQLQALGLSLAQIKLVLSNHDDGELWNTIFEALLHQIDTQIDLLEERRERIAELLDEGVPDALDRNLDRIAIPARVEMYLNQHLNPSQRQVWNQEKKVYAYLGSLNPQDEQRRAIQALVIGLIEGADLYQRSRLIAALFQSQQSAAKPRTFPAEIIWSHGQDDQDDGELHGWGTWYASSRTD